MCLSNCRMASHKHDKTEFSVLYTHQKNKKCKTWQDGYLIVSTQGTKATLLDDKRNQLDALFVRSEQISVGSELESERYLITVEEKSTMGIPEETLQKLEVQVVPLQLDRQQHQQPCHPQKRIPLKRKRMGFTVPRPVTKRPAMEAKDEVENTFSPSTNLSEPCSQARTLHKASLLSTPFGKGSKSDDALARVCNAYDVHMEGTQQSVDQHTVQMPVSVPGRSTRFPSHLETDCQGDFATAAFLDTESFTPSCHDVATPQCYDRVTEELCVSPFGPASLDSISADDLNKQLCPLMQVSGPNSDHQEYSCATEQKENILHCEEESSKSYLQTDSTDIEDRKQLQISGGKRSASQILALLGKRKGKFQPPVKPQGPLSDSKEPLNLANCSSEANSSSAHVSDSLCEPNFCCDIDVTAATNQKDDIAFDSCIFPLRDPMNPKTPDLQPAVPERVSNECPHKTAMETTAPQSAVSLENGRIDDPSHIDDVSYEGQDENLNDSECSLDKEQINSSQDSAIQPGSYKEAHFAEEQKNRTGISYQRGVYQDLEDSNQDSDNQSQNEECAIHVCCWGTGGFEQDRIQSGITPSDRSSDKESQDCCDSKLGEGNQTDNSWHDTRQVRRDDDQGLTKVQSSAQNYDSQWKSLQGDNDQSMYDMKGDPDMTIQNSMNLSSVSQDSKRKNRRFGRRDQNNDQFDKNQNSRDSNEGTQIDRGRDDGSQCVNKRNQEGKAENNQNQYARNFYEESQVDGSMYDSNLEERSQDYRSQNNGDTHVDGRNQNEESTKDQSQNDRCLDEGNQNEESRKDQSQNERRLDEGNQFDESQIDGCPGEGNDEVGSRCINERNQDEKSVNDQSQNNGSSCERNQDDKSQNKNLDEGNQAEGRNGGWPWKDENQDNKSDRSQNDQSADERNQIDISKSNTNVDEGDASQHGGGLHVCILEGDRNRDEKVQNGKGQNDKIYVDKSLHEENQNHGNSNYTNHADQNQDFRILHDEENQDDRSQNDTHLDEQSQDRKSQNMRIIHENEEYQDERNQCLRRLNEGNRDDRSQNDESLQVDKRNQKESENGSSQSVSEGNQCDINQRDRNLGEGNEDDEALHIGESHQDVKSKNDGIQNGRIHNSENLLTDDRSLDDGMMHDKSRHTCTRNHEEGSVEGLSRDNLTRDSRSWNGKTTEGRELGNGVSNKRSSQLRISSELGKSLVLKEIQTNMNMESCSICGTLVHCTQDKGLCPECAEQVATGFELSWKSASQASNFATESEQCSHLHLPLQNKAEVIADDRGSTNSASVIQCALTARICLGDGHLHGSTSAMNSFDKVDINHAFSPVSIFEYPHERSLMVGNCDKMSSVHHGSLVEDWLKNVEPYTCTEAEDLDSVVPQIGGLLPACRQEALQKEEARNKRGTDVPHILLNQDSDQQNMVDVPVDEQCVPVWKDKSKDDNESVLSIHSDTDSSDGVVDRTAQSHLIASSCSHKTEGKQCKSLYSGTGQSVRCATTCNYLSEGYSGGRHYLPKRWKGIARRCGNKMVVQTVEMDVPRATSVPVTIVTNKEIDLDTSDVLTDPDYRGCRQQVFRKQPEDFYGYPESFQNSMGSLLQRGIPSSCLCKSFAAVSSNIVKRNASLVSQSTQDETSDSMHLKQRHVSKTVSELLGQREQVPDEEMSSESEAIQSQSLWFGEGMDKFSFQSGKGCRTRKSAHQDLGLEWPGLSEMQSSTNDVNLNFIKPNSFPTSVSTLELNSPGWPMHDGVGQQYSGVHPKTKCKLDMPFSEKDEVGQDNEWKMEFQSNLPGKDFLSPVPFPPNGHGRHLAQEKRTNSFEGSLLGHSSSQNKAFLNDQDIYCADNKQLNEKGVNKKKKENYWTNPVSSGTVRREPDVPTRREIPPRVFSPILTSKIDDTPVGISEDFHLLHDTGQWSSHRAGSDIFHSWYKRNKQPSHQQEHSRHCEPCDAQTSLHFESFTPQAYQQLESTFPNPSSCDDEFLLSTLSTVGITAETQMPCQEERLHSSRRISNDVPCSNQARSLFQWTEDASPMISDLSPSNWKADLMNWCPAETQKDSPVLYSMPCHRINAQKRRYPAAATTNTKYMYNKSRTEPHNDLGSAMYSSWDFRFYQQSNAQFMQTQQDDLPQISSFLQCQDKVPNTDNRKWRQRSPVVFTNKETDVGSVDFSLSESLPASSSICDLEFSHGNIESRPEICVNKTFTQGLDPWFDHPACYAQHNTTLTPSPLVIQDHENARWTDIFSQRVLPTQARCSKKRGFQNPTVTVAGESSLSSGKSICSELFFPSVDEVRGALSLRRQVEIPVTFSSVAVYKQVLTSALREHLNIILFELSQRYHAAKDKADLQHLDASAMPSQDHPNSSNVSPHCDHGNPAKIVCVKKEGANKGRLFYACGAPRASQCKFFQWADQFKPTASNLKASGSKRPSLLDPTSATIYFRSHNVHLYYGCEFLRRSTSYDALMPGAPAWVRKRKRSMMETSKKKLYLRLCRKESSSAYGKDDIWVISKDLNFDSRSTFLARSVYHGPSSNNDIEIEPLSGYSTSNWISNCIVHALLACNASSDLSCLQNLQEHLNTRLVPVLPVLLSNSWKAPTLTQSRPSTFRCPAPSQNDFRSLSCSSLQIEQVAADMIATHKLNMDQAAALRRVGKMFQSSSKEDINQVPVTLIHGVFGAGKSFLLAVTVLFLVQLFECHDAQHPDGASQTLPWKLLIASTTNVAVDRILLGLLELGFEDFIRVGSIKKIAKPVLPYSVHASDKDNQELRDLYEMLKMELTPTEKHNVRRSIERQRLGRNRDLLGRVRVVAATCAACTFPCLKSLMFPVVLLDECSQMTEPSSLLPIARFQCEKLVLVGDPKQLDPTIQGSEAAHERSLEQTLFNRLILLGHEPILLRTQYRCHPHISAIANCLFYDQQLIDGVSAQDRPPLAPSLPTLCFYSVSSGKECCAFDGSYYNDQEASFVVFMIETLVSLGVDSADIGIITLYKAQVVKINILIQASKLSSQSNLKAIQISTVDAFQGGEKGVVILSCVRTDFMGFADCDKRTNVALTRSKNHLFIVGNLRILAANNLWGKVIKKCRDAENGIQSSQTFMKEWSARLVELLEELGDKRKRNQQKQESRSSQKDQDTRSDCCQETMNIRSCKQTQQDDHRESPSGKVTAQGGMCSSFSSPSYSPLSGVEESKEDATSQQDHTPCFDIGDLQVILE